MNCGIVVAAGKSKRMGSDVDKAFLTLGTRPVLAFSLAAFEKCRAIDSVVVVVRKDKVETARGMCEMLGFHKVRRIVAGAAERQASVEKGLAVIDDDVDIVAVHDGARPCITAEIIEETVKSAKRYGSGISATKVTDTIKQIDRGHVISKTIDRAKLWAVQTPQTFK